MEQTMTGLWCAHGDRMPPSLFRRGYNVQFESDDRKTAVRASNIFLDHDDVSTMLLHENHQGGSIKVIQ